MIRSFSEETYGIPPENLIGSSQKMHFELGSDRCEIIKETALNSFNDRETKVANIALYIGRRPILAFGNSDGDLAMLRYVQAGEGSTLALLLHHVAPDNLN